MIASINHWFEQNPQFDRFLVSKIENIYYATGFWGSFGFLLVAKDGTKTLITDGRYAEVAQQLAHKNNFEFIIFKNGFVDEFGKNLIEHFACEDSLTLGEMQKFKKYFPNVNFEPQTQVWENIRRIKSQDEIDQIVVAQSHVDTVLINFFKENLTVGITEQALNFKLQQVLQNEGTYGLSFPSIIAFGENSSRAHHVSGDRTLKLNDNILVDCGVTHRHYCSDMTRNFIFGTPSEKYITKYQLLRQAQERTHQQIKAGASTTDIDAFCRAELGTETEYFTHSLGHGVGLEIHELPNLSPRTDFTLQAGEIITNEPGLYYPGEFGIRIEDLVLVQKDSGSILSQTSRDLLSFDEAGNVQKLG